MAGAIINDEHDDGRRGAELEAGGWREGSVGKERVERGPGRRLAVGAPSHSDRPEDWGGFLRRRSLTLRKRHV